jgi:dTMP kinase
MVRGFGIDLIEQLNAISTKETYPDLTILLDVEVKTGLKRRANTDKMDRLDLEATEFHEKVRAAYLKLAQAKDDQSKRWVVIDANKSIEQVSQEVWKVVQKALT